MGHPWHLHIWRGLPKLELDILYQATERYVPLYLFYPGAGWYETATGVDGKDRKQGSTRSMSSGAMTLADLNPQARTVVSTQSEMTEIILPNDTNTLGNLLGGRLMHFIDIAGAMAAYRHSRTHVVTAAMDHIDFIRPVHLGDLLTLRSSVNRAFTSSMEVGVKVWAENTRTGVIAHVASAYLVFVAIDEQGRRKKVPEAIAETPDEFRRNEGALRRRETREVEAVRRKHAKQATESQEAS